MSHDGTTIRRGYTLNMVSHTFPKHTISMSHENTFHLSSNTIADSLNAMQCNYKRYFAKQLAFTEHDTIHVRYA